MKRDKEAYHQMSTFRRVTGTFALAAKCWLAIGRGTEAGECLARLGDRAAVRLAAVVTGELSGGTSVLSRVTCHVPGDEDKRQVYSRQCLVECLVTGDTQLARTLVQVTSP